MGLCSVAPPAGYRPTHCFAHKTFLENEQGIMAAQKMLKIITKCQRHLSQKGKVSKHVTWQQTNSTHDTDYECRLKVDCAVDVCYHCKATRHVSELCDQNQSNLHTPKERKKTTAVKPER